jgi:hypothetical protein
MLRTQRVLRAEPEQTPESPQRFPSISPDPQLTVRGEPLNPAIYLSPLHRRHEMAAFTCESAPPRRFGGRRQTATAPADELRPPLNRTWRPNSLPGHSSCCSLVFSAAPSRLVPDPRLRATLEARMQGRELPPEELLVPQVRADLAQSPGHMGAVCRLVFA